MENFFCDLADKISFWMTSFVEQCQYKTISKDENDLIIKSLLKGVLENVHSNYGLEEFDECYCDYDESMGGSRRAKSGKSGDESQSSSVEMLEDEISQISVHSDSEEYEYTSDSGSEFDIDKEGLGCDELMDTVNMYKVKNDEAKKAAAKAKEAAKKERNEEKERLAEEARQKKIAIMKAKAAKRKKKGKQKPKGKWEVDFQQCGKECS